MGRVHHLLGALDQTEDESPGHRFPHQVQIVPLSQRCSDQAVEFFPVVHAALTGSEFAVQQPGFFQEFGPGFHGTPAGSGSGQCHFAVSGGQVHPVHHVAVAAPSFWASAGERVRMDQARWRADSGFHGGQVDVLSLT